MPTILNNRDESWPVFQQWWSVMIQWFEHSAASSTLKHTQLNWAQWETSYCCAGGCSTLARSHHWEKRRGEVIFHCGEWFHLCNVTYLYLIIVHAHDWHGYGITLLCIVFSGAISARCLFADLQPVSLRVMAKQLWFRLCTLLAVAFVITHCESTVAPELGRFIDLWSLAPRVPFCVLFFDLRLHPGSKEFDSPVVVLL